MKWRQREREDSEWAGDDKSEDKNRGEDGWQQIVGQDQKEQE